MDKAWSQCVKASRDGVRGWAVPLEHINDS